MGLVGVAAVLPLAFIASTASATFPGADGRITYSAGNAADSSGIFNVLPNGFHTERLAGPGAFGPSWGPDGRRLLFVRDGDRVRAQFDIFMRRGDGTRRRITNTPRLNETDPSFAPSGKRIIFSQTRGEQHPGLVSMHLDGSHRHRLIEVRGHAYGGRAFRSAEYSPDGKRVVYEHGKAIWVARADFSHTKQLTNPTDALDRDYAPDWSPDGHEIVFSTCRAVEDHCWNETHVMRPNGTHDHRIRCGQYFDRDPGRAVFAPANDRIAVAQPRRIRLMYLDDFNCPDFKVNTDIGDLDWQPLPNG